MLCTYRTHRIHGYTNTNFMWLLFDITQTHYYYLYYDIVLYTVTVFSVTVLVAREKTGLARIERISIIVVSTSIGLEESEICVNFDTHNNITTS